MWLFCSLSLALFLSSPPNFQKKPAAITHPLRDLYRGPKSVQTSYFRATRDMANSLSFLRWKVVYILSWPTIFCAGFLRPFNLPPNNKKTHA